MAENIGHIIQIAGPAVDVQFSEGALPPIYSALRVTKLRVDAPTRRSYMNHSSE